jgi:hypothetical protein
MLCSSLILLQVGICCLTRCLDKNSSAGGVLLIANVMPQLEGIVGKLCGPLLSAFKLKDSTAKR